jgi:hypothetical protein
MISLIKYIRLFYICSNFNFFMNHLLNICEFIISIFPNSSDKVQAWSAFLTLIVTIFMAYYAKIALYSWRDQKKEELIIESKSNMLSAIDSLENLTDISTFLKKYLPSDETGAYHGIYKIFINQNFKEHLNEKLLIFLLDGYEVYKTETLAIKNKLLYDVIKITTYRNTSSHLRDDLFLLKQFYANIAKQLTVFDTSFTMFEMVLVNIHATGSDSEIDYAKELFQTLEDIQSKEIPNLKLQMNRILYEG